MLILDNGQTIVIGDEQYADVRWLPTSRQRFILLMSGAMFLQMVLLFHIDSSVLSNPLSIVLAVAQSLLLLGAVAVFRFFCGLVARSGDVMTAVFDRRQSMLSIVAYGPLGVARRSMHFSEVRAIRAVRGDWSGVSVATNAIVDLESGASIVLPMEASVRELAMLRVLTGLRES